MSGGWTWIKKIKFCLCCGCKYCWINFCASTLSSSTTRGLCSTKGAVEFPDLPRLGEGAGLDPLSQPGSVPKGWPHSPKGYKCKRRNGEQNLGNNCGMQRKQEPEVVWLRQHVQGLSSLWAEDLPDSLLALTRVALQRNWPMELESSFCPDATKSSQATPGPLPVFQGCQWCRLPYFLLSLGVCVWAVLGAALLGLLEPACPGSLLPGIALWPGAKQLKNRLWGSHRKKRCQRLGWKTRWEMKNTQVRNLRRRVTKPGGTQHGYCKIREAS